ncbi:hypothetical protein F5H01DRAFT_289968 [Linnemannia elongata]|uniref:NAD(P)-binding protein n=1 Tax=Linnemannia elongata AG-77 TaxID=1314771 RepID=A0A197JPY9_9FUNG|nr:hypothetical protein F5H01DRAFT_289968 [Linnemannia elongata]OAQ26414.1 NAD(P)-binding protein [Linnemannia elongata AG-77]
MVQNKSAVFLKFPKEFPIPGEHFAIQTKDLHADLKPNSVLLRNLYFSLDPYMRGRMSEAKSYIPHFQLNQPMNGNGVAEVIESKNPAFPKGALVSGMTGWEQYSVMPEGFVSQLRLLPENARTSKKIPLSAYVGVLGMPGFTAYSSLKIIGQPKAGETIFVSAAAGAVGQLVGQMAKKLGLRVVGSAGSDDKVDYLLKELKFDAAFNYKKNGTILENLRHVAPEGVDIYYENVGGETLEAALECMNTHGRIIVCGMISQYNTTTPYGIRNLGHLVAKRITMRGFINDDFAKEWYGDFLKDVGEWLEGDEIIYKEDVDEGIDGSLDAFVGMLKGKNFGKQVVKIADL